MSPTSLANTATFTGTPFTPPTVSTTSSVTTSTIIPGGGRIASAYHAASSQGDWISNWGFLQWQSSIH